MSKIVAWVKEVYGDSNVDWDALNVEGLPNGKYVVRGRDGVPAEIEVNAPNVKDDKFAPWNTCPVGTIQVGLACLADVKTVEPYKEPREDIEYNTWGAKYCPDGYVLGERTEKINIIGMKKPIAAMGIVADEVDMNPELMEPRVTEAHPKIEVEKKLMCVKVESMPNDPEIIRLVTDSIIGWGGYQEFPFWDLPWGEMDDLATKRYHGASLLDEKGFAVCGREYTDDFCLVFSDKKDAEYVKEALDYSNSEEFYEDIKERLKEENGEEPSEEEINKQAEFEKQLFWENLEEMYPSYLGSMSYHQGYGGKIELDNGYVFVVGKRDNSKWHDYIVSVDEKDVVKIW